MLRLQSRVAGVAAYAASLVVLRGAKDARSARTPPKCRHVVTALQGLDLRVSTLFGVDTGCLKAFPEYKLRVSILFVGWATFVIERSGYDRWGGRT